MGGCVVDDGKTSFVSLCMLALRLIYMLGFKFCEQIQSLCFRKTDQNYSSSWTFCSVRE